MSTILKVTLFAFGLFLIAPTAHADVLMDGNGVPPSTNNTYTYEGNGFWAQADGVLGSLQISATRRTTGGGCNTDGSCTLQFGIRSLDDSGAVTDCVSSVFTQSSLSVPVSNTNPYLAENDTVTVGGWSPVSGKSCNITSGLQYVTYYVTHGGDFLVGGDDTNSMIAKFYSVSDGGGIGTDDGNHTNHVIRINEPELYTAVSTTTPVSVSFDIWSESERPPTGYTLTYANTLSGQLVNHSGWLVDSGFSSDHYDSVFTVATSTETLPSEGSWKLTVQLWSGGNGGPSPDPAGTVYTYWGTKSVFFGYGFQDNYQYNDSPNQTYVIYDAESCRLNLNPFEESTFQFADCMGYLFQPTPATYQMYSSLTLRNSAPFSYAYQIDDIRNAIFNSPQTASSTISVTTPIGQMTFLSKESMEAVPFSSLIKTLLSAVMWFLTGMVIYRKVIKSHDNVSHV